MEKSLLSNAIETIQNYSYLLNYAILEIVVEEKKKKERKLFLAVHKVCYNQRCENEDYLRNKKIRICLKPFRYYSV